MTIRPDNHERDVLRVLQSRDETRAYYDKIARVYDLLAERTEQPMREKGLDLLAAQPGERILEIGCGTGHCLVELAKAVGTDGAVHGLDISDAMVTLSRELLLKTGLEERVELHRGDAARTPYPDDSLDGAFISFTLELFDTPEIPEILAEIGRVLRPGGRLAVVSLSKEGKPSLMRKAFEWTHKHFPNLMNCRPIYVRRTIEAAGFAVQAAEIGHMWVPVEIVLAVNP